MDKKLIYTCENPIALERLAKTNRDQALEQERKVQTAMPGLLNFFHTFSDQPGVRFFQGIDGIKDIYNDMLRTSQDVYVFRSRYDQDIMGHEFFIKFKQKKADLGITTYFINPQENKAVWNAETDKKLRTIRTQIAPELYTANVEICTYGNKVSIISFGEEIMGTIIESPQTAIAMKQIFNLAKLGADSHS